MVTPIPVLIIAKVYCASKMANSVLQNELLWLQYFSCTILHKALSDV